MTRLVADMEVSELEALLTRVIRSALHPSVKAPETEVGLGWRFADEHKTKGPDHAPE
jgi:hypothetical protein